MSVTVQCPCCKLGEHRCAINPGTPAKLNADPEDCYPGDAPYLEEVEESTCECLDYSLGLLGVPGLFEKIEDAALSQRWED